MLAAAAALVVLLEKPVRVTARPVHCGPVYCEAQLTVSAGSRRVHVGTTLLAKSWSQALPSIRERVRWKDDYLFVGTDCGGGNAWCCYAERVFALDHGELIDFGHVCPRESHFAGSSYNGTRFLDRYDVLEGNALTAHADAPEFPVIRVRQGDALVTDVDATWEMNRQMFESVARSLAKARRGQFGLRRHVLFNAALAKYCGRQSELRETMAHARRLLTREERSRLADALEEVREGGPPHRSPSP